MDYYRPFVDLKLATALVWAEKPSMIISCVEVGQDGFVPHAPTRLLVLAMQAKRIKERRSWYDLPNSYEYTNKEADQKY